LVGPVAAIGQLRRQTRWIDGLGCLALGEASIAQRDKTRLQLFLLGRIHGLYWSRPWGIKDIKRLRRLSWWRRN
jgi:hypothetical protein